MPVAERAGLRELDHDLDRIDVGSRLPGPRELSRDGSTSGAIDVTVPANSLSGNAAARTDAACPTLISVDVAFVQLGAHVQRRKIGDQQQRLQRGGRGELARLDVDLEHGAVDRRADFQLLQIDAGQRQIAPRGGRSAPRSGSATARRWREAAPWRFASSSWARTSAARGAGQGVDRRAGRAPCRRGLVHGVCASNTAVSASATASSARRRSPAFPLAACSSRSRRRMAACASAAA